MSHVLLLSMAGLLAGAMNALAGGGSFVSLPALIAAAVLAVQLALGIYGGYFGGAVGIMMVAVWGLLENRDPKSLNAPRTLLVSAANVVAVLIFSIAHAVQWPATLVMLVAAMAGGYAGAQIGRRAAPRVIRAGTLGLTACITLAFFERAYLPGLSWR